MIQQNGTSGRQYLFAPIHQGVAGGWVAGGGTAVGGTAVGGTAVGGTAVGGTAVGGTAVGGTAVGMEPSTKVRLGINVGLNKAPVVGATVTRVVCNVFVPL
jgi:hypothetical protein